MQVGKKQALADLGFQDNELVERESFVSHSVNYHSKTQWDKREVGSERSVLLGFHSQNDFVEFFAI